MAVDTTEMQTIVERAGAQLDTLAAKETDLTNQLHDTENALAAFVEAKEQATRDLAAKQTTLTDLEQQHAQAVQLAKLSQGTIKEQNAVQQVASFKKQMDATRKEIIALDKSLTNEKEQRREQAIRAQIEGLQGDLAALRVEITQTSGVRSQARSELGSLKLQAWMEQIAASNKDIDALREQLLTAQVTQQEMLAQAIDALQNHPDHLAQLREALPIPEDGIYRVVSAARLYFEVLAGELSYLPGNPNSQLPALPNHPGWANKAHTMLQQLPDLQRLRIRRGGSWSGGEFGTSQAEQMSKDLAAFLVDYGAYLKEQLGEPTTQQMQVDRQ